MKVLYSLINQLFRGIKYYLKDNMFNVDELKRSKNAINILERIIFKDNRRLAYLTIKSKLFKEISII